MNWFTFQYIYLTTFFKSKSNNHRLISYLITFLIKTKWELGILNIN